VNTEDHSSEGRARPPGEPGLNPPRETENAANHKPGSPGTVRPTRKPLGHEVPAWVADGSPFFITICAAVRGANVFAVKPIAEQLLESVRFLHERGDWYARIFLIIPDHVHGLISVPSDTSMSQRIKFWKGYTARTFGVAWQDRFFDHRIRSDESIDEKFEYIRMNRD